jgi:hypothetical protein
MCLKKTKEVYNNYPKGDHNNYLLCILGKLKRMVKPITVINGETLKYNK